MEISQGLCSPPGDALALVAVLGAALGWALDYLWHMTITVWLLATLAPATGPKTAEGRKRISEAQKRRGQTIV